MEVPVAFPGPPQAGTGPHHSSLPPPTAVWRKSTGFTYPGAMDGVVKVRSFWGQKQPATINGFGLQRNSTETRQTQRKPNCYGPASQREILQREGSCMSSGSCTQALLFAGNTTMLDGNPRSYIHCANGTEMRTWEEAKIPATNTKLSCFHMALCQEHQPPG